MLASHQHITRRSADGAAAVGAGELHPFVSQAIDIGRDAILAAVGRKIPDTRVVDQDEDDVGLIGGGERSEESREEQREEELHRWFTFGLLPSK